MPWIKRLRFIVPFQPIMLVRNLNAWSILHSPSAYFYDSFTNADFWVDWLNCDNYIVFFELIKEAKEKSIDNDDISWFNSRFHGYSVSIADCDYMFFDDIVSGNNWDYSQISHYVFEHLDKYQQLFLNYGHINRPQHIKIASVDSISLRTINNFGIDNIYLRSMFPSLFWIKYFFRVLHIGSIVTICNAIFTAKFTGELVKDHKTLYMAAGIVAIISGRSIAIQDLLTLFSWNQRIWVKIVSFGWAITI